jgi:hypothetical protein
MPKQETRSNRVREREREREMEIYLKTYEENRLSDITEENKKF